MFRLQDWCKASILSHGTIPEAGSYPFAMLDWITDNVSAYTELSSIDRLNSGVPSYFIAERSRCRQSGPDGAQWVADGTVAFAAALGDLDLLKLHATERNSSYAIRSMITNRDHAMIRYLSNRGYLDAPVLLYETIRQGRADMLPSILSYADGLENMNMKLEMRTLISYAAELEDTESLRVLLNAGASPCPQAVVTILQIENLELDLARTVLQSFKQAPCLVFLQVAAATSVGMLSIVLQWFLSRGHILDEKHEISILKGIVSNREDDCADFVCNCIHLFSVEYVAEQRRAVLSCCDCPHMANIHFERHRWHILSGGYYES